jgi:OHCU decarboxylase
MKNKNVERINHFTREIAESHFLDCCGSRKWAQKMTEARPFVDDAELIKKAEKICQNLKAEDWLEAFAAHPKIGAKKAAPLQQAQSATWSKGEQAGANMATETVLDALAEANRLYEEKFGFIFIVCATGKSAEEMLEICRARLSNASETEIQIAADEQRKITEIRLKKLLESTTLP